MALVKWARAFVVSASLVCAGTLIAEPLVKMEGGAAKPNVVTAWTGSGTKVELTIKAGVDAKAVAESIEANVEKVKAKVQGGKVVVIGKAEADLLKALAAVDFGGEGDVGALANAAMQGEESDSGSSLRAKKTADLTAMFKDQAITAQGTVAEAGGASFPNAEVVIAIIRAPSGELGKTVRKGAKVKFKPVLKMKGKDVDWSDENTQLNAGAWYLQKGDRVLVKIGKNNGGVYDAEIISRQ